MTFERHKSKRPPRLLVEWWPKPVIVPGRLSWVHDLVERVGAGQSIRDIYVIKKASPDP